MLAKAGFNPAQGAYSGEDAESSQRRVQLVRKMAGVAHDPALLATLTQAASAWLGGNKAALDPAWYGVGFGAWLEAQGKAGTGLAAAKSLFEKALASQDPCSAPRRWARWRGRARPILPNGCWMMPRISACACPSVCNW
jgi:hypothetical protein